MRLRIHIRKHFQNSFSSAWSNHEIMYQRYAQIFILTNIHFHANIKIDLYLVSQEAIMAMYDLILVVVLYIAVGFMFSRLYHYNCFPLAHIFAVCVRDEYSFRERVVRNSLKFERT